jgi:hypothetical protein
MYTQRLTAKHGAITIISPLLAAQFNCKIIYPPPPPYSSPPLTPASYNEHTVTPLTMHVSVNISCPERLLLVRLQQICFTMNFRRVLFHCVS